MELIFKKSHVYSCVLFCALSCALTGLCMARAAANRMPWADVPAAALLLMLLSGLAAIAINFAWLLVRERILHQKEEPRDYPLTDNTLYASGTILLFSAVLGLSQG
jgi:hypothetical protein